MDDLLATRRAILGLLRTNADLIAVVPKTRIYQQAGVGAGSVWPFVAYGSPTGIPIRAACINGTETTVAIHSFAKPRYQTAGDPKSALLEYAEDYAARIGNLVARALDGKRVPLDRGYLAILFTGSQLLIDGGEADAFHHIANFRARAITS